MAAGKVYAEWYKHFINAGGAHFVWQDTGVGDWLRWRMCTAKQFNDSHDNTYFALAGCLRGKCYAGSQVHWDDDDAANGFTSSAGDVMCADYISTNAIAHYRDYNVPGTMTPDGSTIKARAWFRGTSGRGELALQALDSGDTVLATVTADTGAVTDIDPTDWLDLPATTAKVRVKKNADNAEYIQLVGIDFINTGSTTTPDTAGSMLYDGTDGEAEEVLIGSGWGSDYVSTSFEMALYWAADGGSFSANNAIGGLSHRGIDTATFTWQSQDGSGALTNILETNSDPAGTKTGAVDYVVMTISTAKAYLESACSTEKGTLAGKLIFGGDGVQVKHTVTTSANMDGFGFYNVLCGMPLDLKVVQFYGDDGPTYIAGGSKVSAIKSSGMRCWGASNRVVYDIYVPNVSDDMNYMIDAGAAYYPQVAYNAGGGTCKAYMYRYYDTAAKQDDIDSGQSRSTNFVIRLADRSLALPQAASVAV